MKLFKYVGSINNLIFSKPSGSKYKGKFMIVAEFNLANWSDNYYT
jgi:hypothetical protein